MLFLLFMALATAQLDFSIYEEVVLVKSNTVPEGIKKLLEDHPMLNYTDISSLKYPDNIVRETNILNHLYDNYWPQLKSQIENTVDKLCVSDDINVLEDLQYLHKIHRQYMKNVYHVTAKDAANCRVCDPFAYWFKLRLEEYSSEWRFVVYKNFPENNDIVHWSTERHQWQNKFKILNLPRRIVGADGKNVVEFNVVIIEVNKTQPQLREITRAVEMADATNCKPILLTQILQIDNMFEMFYQIFLRDRPF